MFRLSSLGHNQVVSLNRESYTMYIYCFSFSFIDENEISLNNNDIISYIVTYIV
jgi:hypothetical protein